LACAFALSAWFAGPAWATPADLKRGMEKYLQLCAGCHGALGKGNGPAAAALSPKPRDYTDPKFVSSMSDEAMREIIKNGGAAVGKSPSMPAWGHALSEEDIQGLIAYIRSLALSPRK
jgi:mono/diheme cytochrome c family protein